MIKSNTYGVLRAFNKALTEKQMCEEFDIPQTRKWLKDFYEIYRKSRKHFKYRTRIWCDERMEYPLFSDEFDGKNSVDYSLVKNLTVNRMTYQDWKQFKDNLSAMTTKLYYINKFSSDSWNFINDEIEKFRGFVHDFINYADEVN